MRAGRDGGITFAECPAADVTVELFDRKKSEMPKNAANAGFFGGYSEGGYYFTLPVAHLAADFDMLSVSPPLAKYMEERGKVDGCRWRFDSGAWSYGNGFYGKSVSTFTITNGVAKISRCMRLPSCDYAVSGVPILRGGRAVSFGEAAAEGWSSSSLYATKHVFLGISDTGTVIAAAFSTKTKNMVSSGEAATVMRSLGCVDAIKLDGGGSTRFSAGDYTVKTAEDRQINSIIRFKTSFADKLVCAAKAELGYAEKKSNAMLDSKMGNAGRANWTKYGEWYGINPGAWCAMFVSWCADRMRIPTSIIPKAASCGAMLSTLRKQGRAFSPGEARPEAGDLIFFSKYGDAPTHVGIVTGSDGDSVSTIEGNTSGGSGLDENGGCVAAKQYALGYSKIFAYGKVRGVEDTMMPNLKKGDKTPAAGALQTLLNYRGADPELDVDCSFGGKTRTAVLAFQKSAGLPQTGEVSAAEWAALANG